jgi:hypothetical protein
MAEVSNLVKAIQQSGLPLLFGMSQGRISSQEKNILWARDYKL